MLAFDFSDIIIKTNHARCKVFAALLYNYRLPWKTSPKYVFDFHFLYIKEVGQFEVLKSDTF